MAINPEEIDVTTVDKLDDLTLALGNFFAHTNLNGKLGKATINQLATFVAPYVTAIGGSGFLATTGTVLPAASAGKFTIVGAGTFTQTTGGSVVTTELLNILGSSATTWSLVKAIPLPSNVKLKTDAEWPTFQTVAAANTAIKNEVVGGKNSRDGKLVQIGRPGAYEFYTWSGGLSDINLSKIEIGKESLSRNLFPVDNLEAGYYVNFLNGNYELQSGFSAVHRNSPIKCKPSIVYSTNYVDYAYAFLDINLAYISGINAPTPTGQFSTPANCEYFTTYVKDTEKPFLTIVEGDVVLIKDENVRGRLNFGVKAEKVAGIDLLGNEKLLNEVDLFDSTKIRPNTYVDYLTGKTVTVAASVGAYTSEPIKIKPGKTYEFGDTTQQQFIAYDKSGKPILSTGYATILNGASKFVTFPLNAHHFVFTGATSAIANQYLIERKGVVELHNPANKTAGKYVAYTNGAIIDNADTNIVKVPVTPNTTYEFGDTVQQQLAWFKKDGTTYISGYAGSISGYEKQLTSPNQAFYVVYTTNNLTDVSQSFKKVEIQDVVKTIKITAVKNATNWNSVRNTVSAIKDASFNKRYEITVPIGTWNEIDWSGYGDYIEIIGQDRYRTIINTPGADTNANFKIPADYMGTGEYAGQQIATVPLIWKHTIFAHKNLRARNFTFKAASCKYVLHADDKRYSKVTLDNCSYEETLCNFVIGVGVWGGQNLEITNSTIKRAVAGNAGIVFHNWNNQLAGTKTLFSGLRFINCYYADVYELGSDQEDALIFENCSSDTENKIKYFVTMENGATMYTIPGGSVKQTNPQLVPYSIHTVIAGTNVDNYDISSGQRPNALLYVQQGSANVSKSDLQYKGTFDSIALAISGVPLATRKLGDTVGIKENGSVVEYWWKTVTTDLGLIIKTPELKVSPLPMALLGAKESDYTTVKLGDTSYDGSNTTDGNVLIAGTPAPKEFISTFLGVRLNIAGTGRFYIYDKNWKVIHVTPVLNVPLVGDNQIPYPDYVFPEGSRVGYERVSGGLIRRGSAAVTNGSYITPITGHPAIGGTVTPPPTAVTFGISVSITGIYAATPVLPFVNAVLKTELTPNLALLSTKGLYYDFSDKRTLYKETEQLASNLIFDYNTPVSVVADLSGQGFQASQSTLSKRPLFVKHPIFGLDCLSFDGIDDTLTVSGQFTTGDFTFIAAIASDPGVNPNIYSEYVNPAIDEGRNVISVGTSVGAPPVLTLLSLRSNSNGVSHKSARAAADKNIRIIACRVSTGTDGNRKLEIWLDDRKVDAIVSGNGVFGLQTTVSTIGARQGSPGENGWFKGYMFGMFICEKALTDTDVSTLMTGFAKKYYTPIMIADGAGSNSKLPRALYVGGQKLISTISHMGTVLVTALIKKGWFSGVAFPVTQWTGAENHNAASILHLSNGKVMSASNRHNAFDLKTRVTTNPNSIETWDAERSQSAATMNLAAYDYPSLAEFNGFVYIFGRGWRTSDGETNVNENRWFSKLPVGDVSTTNFPLATKIVSAPVGYRPYMMFKKSIDGVSLPMLWSTGNPGDGGQICNVHYTKFRVIDGVESMVDVMGNNIPFGTSISTIAPIYDAAADGKKAWILDITEDVLLRPRVAYVVYEAAGLQSYWSAKWNGTEWIRAKICDAGSSFMPGTIAHAGCVFDPEDYNVIVAGVKRSNVGLHQMTRFTSDDDSNTWNKGQQLTSEVDFFGAELPCFFPKGTPENRLTYECGGIYEDYNKYRVYTKNVNSTNGQTK